jgi:hypothetical protein
MEILRPALGLIAGGMIGFAFGVIQNAALRRNEKRQLEGKLNNGWRVMPGSGVRVAYLMIALVLVQIICPLLFKDGTQWWVSAGVVIGYGIVLFRQLQQQLARNK